MNKNIGKLLTFAAGAALVVTLAAHTVDIYAADTSAVDVNKTYAKSESKTNDGLTLTVSYDAPKAGEAMTFHAQASRAAGGTSDKNYKYFMSAPTYTDLDKRNETLSDPTRGGGYTSAVDTYDFKFTPMATGTYNFDFYAMDISTTPVTTVKLQFSVEVSDEKYPAVSQIVAKTAEECKKHAATDYDRALWLHDWLIDHMEYDKSLYWCSVESALTRKFGTCESYWGAYSRLLDAVGIENGRVVGNGHVWNAVKIDGEWCQVDCTWDDSDAYYGADGQKPYGKVAQRHLYFGLTDEAMSLAHPEHATEDLSKLNKPYGGASVRGYKSSGYKYRSTTLKNNYFVRNKEARQWAEGYTGRISDNLSRRASTFSVAADNTRWPPSIYGIVNSITAWQINNSVPAVNGVKVSAVNAAYPITYGISRGMETTTPAKGFTFTPEYGDPLIADGIYTIGAAKNPAVVLDISGGSVDDFGNVQLYSANETAAQTFEFTYDKNTGYYKIVNLKSGKAVDVSAGQAVNWNNVQQYQSNDTLAQRWIIEKAADGIYVFRSAINPNYVLDIAGGNVSDGSNIQVYEYNGTQAQKFVLKSATRKKTLDDGIYTFKSRKDGSFVLDISGGSMTGGGNLQIYEGNNTAAQKFSVKRDGRTGYYTITNIKSGLVIDLSCGNVYNGSNIQQWWGNGTLAQQWIIDSNYDGSYTIKSAVAPAYVLDVAGGNMSNGSNIQLYESNGTDAQKFNAVKV